MENERGTSHSLHSTHRRLIAHRRAVFLSTHVAPSIAATILFRGCLLQKCISNSMATLFCLQAKHKRLLCLACYRPCVTNIDCRPTSVLAISISGRFFSSTARKIDDFKNVALFCASVVYTQTKVHRCYGTNGICPKVFVLCLTLILIAAQTTSDVKPTSL